MKLIYKIPDDYINFILLTYVKSNFVKKDVLPIKKNSYLDIYSQYNKILKRDDFTLDFFVNDSDIQSIKEKINEGSKLSIIETFSNIFLLDTLGSLAIKGNKVIYSFVWPSFGIGIKHYEIHS